MRIAPYVYVLQLLSATVGLITQITLSPDRLATIGPLVCLCDESTMWDACTAARENIVCIGDVVVVGVYKCQPRIQLFGKGSNFGYLRRFAGR